MRVSLAPTRLKSPPPGAGEAPPLCLPLLAGQGPRVMLGGKLAASGLAEPIAPAADTLFGPRGACLAGPGGPLFVCDTGHHRLLVWKTAPNEDHAPADLVIGQ